MYELHEINCKIFFLADILLGGCLRIELSCIQVRSVSIFHAEYNVILCAAGCSTCVCLCVLCKMTLNHLSEMLLPYTVQALMLF